MDEFAMGSSPKIPLSASHATLGYRAYSRRSSGGSAAAVAADECIASLGTTPAFHSPAAPLRVVA